MLRYLYTFQKFDVSIFTISYWLKRLGYSYKKNFTYMEANEEKHKIYQEAIRDITPKNFICIDKSGIELTMCKDRGWSKNLNIMTNS